MEKRILSSDVSNLKGQKVLVQGWAQTIRLHAKVGFIDLRDRTGLTQLVATGELLEALDGLSTESVIEATGEVQERPQSLINPNIISGTVEVALESLKVITKAETLPMPLNDGDVGEEIRLKYRYLDLRSKRMADNIRIRHRLNNFIREFLTEKEFVEVETPVISKSTPEGARDYLVPSRIAPGQFYALPQSPQQYKQLLMVAGMERYFQIARCFRDEDSRGDRQPEFSQIDIELSFTSRDEVLELIETMVRELVQKFFPEKVLTSTVFPRLKYADVMKEHGSDKPDFRHDKTNDDELAFLFVVDFPLFEWKEKENRFDATHHPFTQPAPESVENFETQPKEALALQYDLVLNGTEIAGGSIRIHDPKLLKRVFMFMGHTEKKVEADFGHLLEAFSYGVPPHGGIAVGWDRLLSILLKEASIRDVIAFPKTGDGRDLLMNAPSPVSSEQLSELGIKITTDATSNT